MHFPRADGRPGEQLRAASPLSPTLTCSPCMGLYIQAGSRLLGLEMQKPGPGAPSLGFCLPGPESSFGHAVIDFSLIQTYLLKPGIRG
mgnify:CR=1 FL=1